MTHPEDLPQLTHHSLGELTAEETAALEQHLQQNPHLQQEWQQTQQVVDALRAQVPELSDTLHADQRQRILAAAAQPLPKRARPAGAGRPLVRPTTRWRLFDTLGRAAAMVALAGASYWIGTESMRMSLPADGSLEQAAADPMPDLEPVSVDPEPVSQPELPLVAEKEETAAPVEMAATRPESPEVPSPAPVAAEDPAPAEAVPASTPALLLATTHDLAKGSPVATDRNAKSRLQIHPQRVLPELTSDAAALSAKMGAAPKTEAPVEKPDQLFIHSWRAEVAPSPWRENHRLLRVSLQMPADQAGATTGDHAFPFEIQFDTLNVREHRYLGSRSYPADAMDHAGRQVFWFEFRSNGKSPSSQDPAQQIATIQLPEARFTTRAAGPFSSDELVAQDRGATWEQSRAEFRADAAMMALALLLEGSPDHGNLNMDRVLEMLPTEGEGPAAQARKQTVEALKTLAQLSGLN